MPFRFTPRLRMQPALQAYRGPVIRPRIISLAPTAVTALIGTAQRADAAPLTPTVVHDFRDFVQHFGDPAAPVTHLAHAVRGFFDNGGQKAVILNLGANPGPIGSADLDPLVAMTDIALLAAPGFTDPASQDALITHCETCADRFAVLDTPETVPTQAAYARVAAAGGVRPRSSDGGFAAAYAPWIEVPDPGTGAGIPCPPSGHICGIYARNDATRGVHKTPAGIPVRGALGPTQVFSDTALGALTVAHVNPLRLLPHGLMVWGGRSLAASTSEYRYVAVRRLALMLRQSIAEGTTWAGEEPNGLTLWREIRTAVTSVMYNQFRRGAFSGSTPSDAFFVRCDRTTTTQEDIHQRRANVLVGFAPMRPAEFVILKIGIATA